MMDQATRLRQLVGTEDSSAKGNEAQVAIQPVQRAAVRTGAWASARVIAVTSGKGGVGKTNITVNLAIALEQLGYRVLVIDADLGMANIDILLGIASRRSMLDLLRPDISLADVVVDTPFGIKYISGGSGIEKALDYDRAEKEMLQQKLSECTAHANLILVDTGAGLGRSVMDFILAADEVLLITTPEPTSLTDAYAVMKAYSIYAMRKNLRLIVNRVYDQQESAEVVAKLQRAADKFLHMPVECLGYVFEDAAVTRAVRRQMPLIKAAPRSAAARCIEALAKSLVGRTEMRTERGWKGFLQQIFKF